MNVGTQVPTDHTPTYHHFVGGIKWIDHILTTNDSTLHIKSSYIDMRNPLNMSSHDPVVGKVKINTVQPLPLQDAKAITAKRKPNWDKIDLQLYKEKTAMRLRSLLDHGGVELPPEKLIDRLYDILLTSADESAPVPRTRRDKIITHGLHISSHISTKSKPCSTNGSHKVSKRMTPLPSKLPTIRSTSYPFNGKWQPKTGSNFSRK